MSDTRQNGPDTNEVYPLPQHKRMVFLKNIIINPHIEVGDYTYYDDFADPHSFEKNVLYNFPFVDDKLIIGKFCSIASGAKFILNGGNHRIDRFTTYPFEIFGNSWKHVQPDAYPNKGNIVIGSDVWLGYNTVIMPGVNIGHGAIIGTCAVVTKDVPPYAIVGGNPAQVIRYRFDDETIHILLGIAWWDWEIEKITRNLSTICQTDIEKLRQAV